ncbi:MAG: tRNA 2-thiouridine(34) synthase MnmA [Stomatobaculum sp.]|nr:tRNA 2-thiouridine(34) synthase MnmA [Stomatobaculum sp.]
MKALVAMSGGVDSSVAALLTKEKGLEVIGCTMKLYSNEEIAAPEGKTCCSLDDAEDARSVARRLEIPFYVFNYQDAFREQVISPFVKSYEAGRTPNPCIDCNRCLKFGALYRRAEELGCERIVTGHYVRITEENGAFHLRKGADASKDQSYVLYMLTQEQLSHTLFPLGEFQKNEARRLAEEHGLVTARKKESQDICFVPDGDYASAIRRFSGEESRPGDFVDLYGQVLGRHKGIIHYTLGQRRGLGISAASPLYVVRIDPASNTVVLGSNEDLFTRELEVPGFHWIAGKAPGKEVRCRVKVRYRHTEQPAVVQVLEGNKVRIVFDEPQRAITPGQSAVAYDGDEVLGGGVILPVTMES